VSESRDNVTVIKSYRQNFTARRSGIFWAFYMPKCLSCPSYPNFPYTPPTPTRRDSTVSSRRRRRCVLGERIMAINVINFEEKAENLFNGIESSLSSRQIVRVFDVSAVASPRPICNWCADSCIREESKVAIRHVVVLGVVQKLREAWVLRMTEDDHCRIRICTKQHHETIVRENMWSKTKTRKDWRFFLNFQEKRLKNYSRTMHETWNIPCKPAPLVDKQGRCFFLPLSFPLHCPFFRCLLYFTSSFSLPSIIFPSWPIFFPGAPAPPLNFNPARYYRGRCRLSFPAGPGGAGRQTGFGAFWAENYYWLFRLYTANFKNTNIYAVLRFGQSN